MNQAVNPLSRVALATFVVIAVAVVYYGAQSPSALPLDAPPTAFSGQRALTLSHKFAVEPRPRGGDAAARGRDFLVQTLEEYGLEVEIQRDPINHGNSISFAENVMARIPGTDSAQTFAMTAHYDSVAWGPGAADDGAGVVVMLEAARALKAGPALKNDVVFIFTSDEEGGGNASVNSLKHRWLKDLNVMFGLEGRGDWGTAYMFETSEGNLPLMRELAKSGAPAISNSIMYQVHSQTPNTTDFTHMTKKGALGYNVAFVGGLGYYHTANDKPEHVSPNTLQHQGEYALALVRHYDNGGPKIAKGEDAVFFNTLGKHLVVYPASYGRTFAVIAVVVFLIVLALGLLTRSIGILGLIGSLAIMLVSMVLSGVIGGALQWVSYKLFYVYIMYNAAFYHISFFFLAAAIAVALLTLLRDKLSPENLHAAVLVIWLGQLIALEIKLPIASYAGTWPLLFGALGLGIAVLLRKVGVSRGVTIFIQSVSALPILAFLVPGLQALYWMGGALTPAANSLIFLGILFALAPALLFVIDNSGKRVALVCALLAVIVFLCGWAAQRFSSEKPKMNSLSYALNLDTNQAIWISTDKQIDEWVGQFMPTDKMTHGDFSDVLPGHHREYAFAPAPIVEFEASTLSIVEDTIAEGKRTLALRYTFTRSINEARFTVPGPAKVLAASVDGVGDVLADMSGWSLNVGYLPYNKEMVLRLTLDASVPGPIQVEVIENTLSIPDVVELGYKPRPDWMIPKPNTLDWWENNHFSSHQSFVTQTYAF